MKQLKTKINHSEKELKEKKHQLLSKREEADAVEKELNTRRNDMENVKMALESLPYEDGQMEALQKVCFTNSGFETNYTSNGLDLPLVKIILHILRCTIFIFLIRIAQLSQR